MLGLLVLTLSVVYYVLKGSGVHTIITGNVFGAFMIAAGCLGISSAKVDRKGLVLGCMVMSIISCAGGVVVLGVFAYICRIHIFSVPSAKW